LGNDLQRKQGRKEEKLVEYWTCTNGLLKKNKQTMKRRKRSRRWKEEAKETWKLIVKL
jgi:hypothetical protein